MMSISATQTERRWFGLVLVGVVLLATGFLVDARNRKPTPEYEATLLTGELQLEILPGLAVSPKNKYLCAVYTQNGKRGLVTPALQIITDGKQTFYTPSYAAWRACSDALIKAGISTKRSEMKRYDDLWTVKVPPQPNGSRT